jgi:hypothetical protein
MKRIITLVILLVAITFSKAQIKILFDATKAEMAGNGDWVIDADLHNLKANSNGTVTVGGSDSNPQKLPLRHKVVSRQVRPKLIGPVL